MSLYDYIQSIESLEKTLKQLSTAISNIRKLPKENNQLERMLRIQQKLKSIRAYILIFKEEISQKNIFEIFGTK